MEQRLYNLREAAQILNYGFGRNILYEWLKEFGVVDINNSPKSEFLEKGYFVKKVIKKKWCNQIFICTLVTEEGLKFIKQLLEECEDFQIS